MGIVVRFIAGGAHPMAICDECGERIEQVSWAVIPYATSNGDQTEIVTLHQELCSDKWKTVHADQWDGWDTLESFIDRLLINVGYPKVNGKIAAILYDKTGYYKLPGPNASPPAPSALGGFLPKDWPKR